MSSSGKALAIASHVVSGFVGNNVVTFVLQTLGIEVSALNTVQFSNHTGYHQWTGSKVTAEEILQLWKGLKNVTLDDELDMAITGYVPGDDGVEAIGQIIRELKGRKKSFFWLLDPVMGDEGKLYVSESVVPVYRSLVGYADLITPNQYEIEWLTGQAIIDRASIHAALQVVHDKFSVPHVIITSIVLPSDTSSSAMICAGSTITSSGKSRPFFLEIPIIEGHYRGTGDMFSALTLARFREQVSLVPGLLEVKSWVSPDIVTPTELPLAKAIEKVLVSMNLLLERTRKIRSERLGMLTEEQRGNRIEQMKAGELRLVQGVNDILRPEDAEGFVVFESQLLQE